LLTSWWLTGEAAWPLAERGTGAPILVPAGLGARLGKPTARRPPTPGRSARQVGEPQVLIRARRGPAPTAYLAGAKITFAVTSTSPGSAVDGELDAAGRGARARGDRRDLRTLKAVSGVAGESQARPMTLPRVAVVSVLGRRDACSERPARTPAAQEGMLRHARWWRSTSTPLSGGDRGERCTATREHKPVRLPSSPAPGPTPGPTPSRGAAAQWRRTGQQKLGRRPSQRGTAGHRGSVAGACPCGHHPTGARSCEESGQSNGSRARSPTLLR
jgi:hypothetical protein